MRRLGWWAVQVASCALLGCAGGDGSDDPAGRLLGSWAGETNDGTLCALGVSFLEDDVYESDYVCELQSGRLGVQAEVGIYQADGELVTLTPTHTSCPDADDAARAERWVFDFINDGETIRLSNTHGSVILDRLEDVDSSGGASVAVFGCYASDGSFLESELVEL